MTPEDIRKDREQGTDGPWEVGVRDTGTDERYVRGNHFEICKCLHHCVGGIEKEMEANARRIARLPELEEAYLAQAAEIERLREAIKYADSLVTIEINPSNYGHDDVCLLNDQTTEALLHLLAALKSEEKDDE